MTPNRQRSTEGYRPGYHVTWKQVNDYFPEFDAGPYDPRYWTARYEVSSALPAKGSSTRATWNPFQHYVLESVPSDGSFEFGSYDFAAFPPLQWSHCSCSDPRVGWVGESVGFGSWDRPNTGLPQMYNPQADGFVAIPGVNDIELRDNAFYALLPQLKPLLSLPNSLIELKDAKTVVHTMERLKRLYFHSYGRKTLRQILRAIGGAGSDVYLQVKFNVQPFFSDIANMRKILEKGRQDTNNLLDNAGKRRILRSSVSLGSKMPSFTESSLAVPFGNQSGHIPGGNTGLCRANRIVKYTDAQFHAQMEYSYSIPDWQRENAAIRGLLDQMGVNLNPVILWNAIPWSFVLDWVIGVNRYLTRFRQSNLEPCTTIHRWCWSVSATRVIISSKDMGIGGHQAGSAQVARLTETAYKRSTSTPDINTAIHSSGLSPTEISLGAALAGSRLS
jgi:hypothetical protein